MGSQTTHFRDEPSPQLSLLFIELLTEPPAEPTSPFVSFAIFCSNQQSLTANP
jgi:hypothetical protein